MRDVLAGRVAIDRRAATARLFRVHAVKLVSFDIDGTLEVADRPVAYQQELWRRLEIAADFTVLKHRLADVKALFSAAAYFHVGDTDVDAFYAIEAGFSFLRAHAPRLDGLPFSLQLGDDVLAEHLDG